MRKAIKQLLLPLRKAANRFVNPAPEAVAPTYIASPDSIIYKAAAFTAINKVEGDYLEFGVYQGGSYIFAYHTLKHSFDDVINRWGFTMSEKDRLLTSSLFRKMRFFAFDSFEGLPEITDADTHGFFSKGQFSASLDTFNSSLKAAGVPLERSVVVNGWYDQTLTPTVYDRHQLTKAAIVHIDCDLYESTRVVLEFITPLLVDGTIIIFDDWFHFNGHPQRGEQKAFHEWTAKLTNWSFSDYQQEGGWRKSFIASKH